MMAADDINELDVLDMLVARLALPATYGRAVPLWQGTWVLAQVPRTAFGRRLRQRLLHEYPSVPRSEVGQSAAAAGMRSGCPARRHKCLAPVRRWGKQ